MLHLFVFNVKKLSNNVKLKKINFWNSFKILLTISIKKIYNRSEKKNTPQWFGNQINSIILMFIPYLNLPLRFHAMPIWKRNKLRIIWIIHIRCLPHPLLPSFMARKFQFIIELLIPFFLTGFWPKIHLILIIHHISSPFLRLCRWGLIKTSIELNHF